MIIVFWVLAGLSVLLLGYSVFLNIRYYESSKNAVSETKQLEANLTSAIKQLEVSLGNKIDNLATAISQLVDEIRQDRNERNNKPK